MIVTRPDTTSDPQPIAIDGPTAAKLTGVSMKTLNRLAEKGEPIGRIKVGSRVLFLRDQLESWLRAKALH